LVYAFSRRQLATRHDRRLAVSNKSKQPKLIELETPAEAAKTLRVSERFLQLDRSTKREIPYVKIGRFVRYRRSDLFEYLERNVIGGAD